MSLREVVANLEETPSSQERAFWRETSGAADIKSEPTATDAYALDALTVDFNNDVRFSNTEEAIAFMQLKLVALMWDLYAKIEEERSGWHLCFDAFNSAETILMIPVF